MPNALSVAQYMHVNTPWKRMSLLPVVLVGAAGAIDATRSSAGFTVVAGGSGVYSGTMPTGTRALIFSQAFEPTTPSSSQFNVTALDAKAGTWAGVFSSDTTEADIEASGELWLLFMIEGG